MASYAYPGFRTTFGASEAFGQIVDRLEHQFARDMTFVFGNNFITEVFLKILTDYENELPNRR